MNVKEKDTNNTNTEIMTTICFETFQNIINSTLCIDDLRKLAIENSGKLCGQPRGEKLSIIISAECTAIYTMNQYLWEKHQIIRYAFHRIKLLKPKQR